MLSPENRLTLTDALNPPPGYTLSQAVGTSFTVDLESALLVPLSLTSKALGTELNPVNILSALGKVSDRINIFVQAGMVTSKTDSKLLAQLENMLHPVKTPKGIFHPKVWFLEYEQNGLLSYRLLVLSRNLTTDRSWDLILQLDGKALPDDATDTEKSDIHEINGPLADFISKLPNLTVHTLDDAKRKSVNALANKAKNIIWDLPDDAYKIRFYFLDGSSTGIRNELPDFTGSKVVIISPFIDSAGLKLVGGQINGETVIISRPESLDALPKKSLDLRAQTYVFDSALETEAAPENESGSSTNNGVRLRGLHAKAISYMRQQKSYLLMGSANATFAAWNKNVEFMVELTGSRRSFSPTATFEALEGLIERYEPSPEIKESLSDAVAYEVDETLRELAGTQFFMQIEDGEPYSLRVWAEENLATKFEFKRAQDVTFNWHIYGRKDLGSIISLHKPEKFEMVLHELELTDISPFIVFEATALFGDGEKYTAQSIVVGQIINDNPERRAKIMALNIKDRSSFMRLIGLMLEMSSLSGAGSELALASYLKGNNNPTAGGEAPELAIMEPFLRALDRNPESLKDINNIIKAILKQTLNDASTNNDSEGKSVVPEGFAELWANIETVLRRMEVR